MGRGWVNRQSEGGRIWWMYFVYLYKNKTMKPVKIVLRRVRAGGRMMEWMNLIKTYCKHICKCHNETL
jgi:hypothetical protein